MTRDQRDLFNVVLVVVYVFSPQRHNGHDEAINLAFFLRGADTVDARYNRSCGTVPDKTEKVT